MKIVINTCFGGFSISEKAESEYRKRANVTDPKFYSRDIPRNDPILVAIIEKMGEEADGDYAQLKVVEIPDDANWTISEYDGSEHIAEVHRTWY